MIEGFDIYLDIKPLLEGFGGWCVLSREIDMTEHSKAWMDGWNAGRASALEAAGIFEAKAASLREEHAAQIRALIDQLEKEDG